MNKIRSRLLSRTGLAAIALAAGLGATLAQDQYPISDIALPAAGDRSYADHVYSSKVGATIAAPGEATRIIGGRESAEGAWPHQVALLNPERIEDTEESRILSQFCGGSLITREWVLTAAHCVVDQEGKPVDPRSFVIQTGSVSVARGDLREVSQVIVHEDYDSVRINNDIALVQLSEPITQSSGPVGAIRVLGQGQAVPQGPAVVIGWGLIAANTVPNQLLETDIDIVPNATCNQGMAEQTRRDLGGILVGIGRETGIPLEKIQEAFDILSTNIGARLTPQMICAGIPSGERTSCNGDSGGPLMVREQDGRWLQVGIVSWGQEPLGATEPCGHAELYSVYTNLAEFFDWIARHVRG
ncbi:MAG: serine protease [Pseudomonadota bacterium]